MSLIANMEISTEILSCFWFLKNTPSYLKYFLPVIVFPCDRANGPKLFVFMKKSNMQNVFRERERENLLFIF